MKPSKLRTMALLVSASTLLGIGAAYADVVSVQSSIRFLTHLAFGTISAPNFGDVQAATAGTYVLDTSGGVTATGLGVKEGGTPAAGSYTITGSTHQAFNISAGNYSPNGGTSTPSLATCKYNGVAVAGADCTGTGLTAGAALPLLVGLTVVTTGAADNVTETPKFDLTIVYQ
jgi:hypothetical protein